MGPHHLGSIRGRAPATPDSPSSSDSVSVGAGGVRQAETTGHGFSHLVTPGGRGWRHGAAGQVGWGRGAEGQREGSCRPQSSERW